jgi:hypothetical protein
MVVLLALGCSNKRTDVPGQCLPLPSTNRSELTADPEGNALYWFEPVRAWDFDAEMSGYSNLVRFDLRTRELTRVADHVRAPIIFTRLGIVVPRDVGEFRSLYLVERTGNLQQLLPDYLRPDDAERIDDHTIAVLARGDTRHAVYVLDLDRPRPTFLIEADTLLSVSGTVVFTQKDADGVSVDLATGVRRKFSVPNKVTPQGSDLWYVADQKIHVRSMTTDADRAPPVPARPWKLVHEYGQVLARTSPKDGDVYALLLRNGAAEKLADIRGKVTVMEALVADERTWALIGHNSSNYDGDVALTNAETDVCVLPETGSVTFQTRSVPQRFLDREAAIFAALETLRPKATLQIMDSYNEPTTAVIDVPEPGGNDMEAMRQRARFFHERVTSILGDREIRTDVQFSDGRIAHMRWRRERLGLRATAGMGPGVLADLASYPLELQQRAIAKDAGHITCSGTLVNLRPLPLVDVQVRCIRGDRKRVIAIGTLPPGGSARFSESYAASEDDNPQLQISAHDDPIDYLDRVDEDRDRKVFELGVAIYDATHLAIDSRTTEDGFYVELKGSAEFADQPEAKRLAAVEDAYQRLQALRPLYSVDDATKLSIHIELRRSSIMYDYDGEKLTVDD